MNKYSFRSILFGDWLRLEIDFTSCHMHKHISFYRTPLIPDQRYLNYQWKRRTKNHVKYGPQTTGPIMYIGSYTWKVNQSLRGLITCYNNSNDKRYYVPVIVSRAHRPLLIRFRMNYLVDTGSPMTQVSWKVAISNNINTLALPWDNRIFNSVAGADSRVSIATKYPDIQK
jgi:hypothetical protein